MPVADFLGEDYDYINAFYNPRDCVGGVGPCMGEQGDKIIANLEGTVSYGNALLFESTPSDPNRVIKNTGPLGNKYFINSGIDCKTPEGKDATKYIFVNNQPSGNLPFLDKLVGEGGMPRGLIPGLMSNVARLNPIKLLSALKPEIGDAAECKERTVKEIRQRDNGTHRTDMVKVYMTDGDYNEALADGLETFSSIYGDNDDPRPDDNYSKMPDDTLIQIYLSTLTITGMYILLKFMNKR
jgi:hypothetical protein